MISQCANPDCRRELHYLRDGKIYQFVFSSQTGNKRLEHFWLCGECSKTMILICVDQSEVKTVGKDGHPELNPVTVWHHPKKRAL
jgi:hypothetical protein